MATVLHIDGPDPEPAAIDRLAWEAHKIRAAEVERRVIEGENRIEFLSASGGTITYRVPRWGEHPIRRFRIALARWKETRRDR